MTTGRRRLFLMTGWQSRLGAAVRPVGILALDTTGRSAEVGESYRGHVVAWVPGHRSEGDVWRTRLIVTAPTDLPDAVTVWANEGGTSPLILLTDEAPEVVQNAGADLASAAAAGLDAVLAEILPLAAGDW